MREIESTFSIMFPNDSLHTQYVISLCGSLFNQVKKGNSHPFPSYSLQNKKEQPPQAVLSYAILLLVIVILTAMTNAVES